MVQHSRRSSERTISDDPLPCDEVTGGGEAAERAIVEKIHVLPVYKEAPAEWVFAHLTDIMRRKTIVHQYMRLAIKSPEGIEGIKRDETDSEDNKSAEASDQREFTYIVVACLPHSGLIKPSTVVFTNGSPLQPLRRVQLLALIHPNSAYARRAGVTCYMDALNQGVVRRSLGTGSVESRGLANNISRTNPDVRADREDSQHVIQANNEVVPDGTSMSSPFRQQNRRRRLPFAGNSIRRAMGAQRAAQFYRDMVTELTNDSVSSEGSEDDNAMGEGNAFHLSDYIPESSGVVNASRVNVSSEAKASESQRTVQRHSTTSKVVANAGDEETKASQEVSASRAKREPRVLTEDVLFHEFVAPYLRQRNFPGAQKAATTQDIQSAINESVVLFPGKKLVVKEVTFVVWATDPPNTPGFVHSDTVVSKLIRGPEQSIYITIDPWGEYRRVHILPFVDTLPTTYSFRLFEDYLQPYLKEQPWRLIKKSDIFTYRGVEFKIIATEPSSVPVARVGPETIIHFEGTLNPTLVDVLPPEVLMRVRRLPARLQPYAVYAAAQSLDPNLILRVLPGARTGTAQQGIDDNIEAAFERRLVCPFSLTTYRRNFGHLSKPKSSEEKAEHEAYGLDRHLPGCSEISNGPKDPESFLFSAECPRTQSKTSVEAVADTSDIEAPSCTVCTIQLQEGVQSLTLPCGHSFHWECVRAWLHCSATCPNCRAAVALPSENDKRDDQEDSVGETFAFVRSAIADFFRG